MFVAPSATLPVNAAAFVFVPELTTFDSVGSVDLASLSSATAIA